MISTHILDTARGAIWKAGLDHNGRVTSRTNCDTTFLDAAAPDRRVLCLDNIFVQHAYLEGADGFALDRRGHLWVDANERNAVIFVTRHGDVFEVFRNPPNAAGLRSSADNAADNKHILEFPTSPFLVGKKLCTSNSDGDRRDNSPRSAGEIDAGGAVGARGKISCMDQELFSPGLPLPVSGERGDESSTD